MINNQDHRGCVVNLYLAVTLLANKVIKTARKAGYTDLISPLALFHLSSLTPLASPKHMYKTTPVSSLQILLGAWKD